MSSLLSDESAGRPAWACAAVWAVFGPGASSQLFKGSRAPLAVRPLITRRATAWLCGWVVALAMCVAGNSARAQAVGDSEATVEDLLGRPTLTRQVGDTVTAIYGNGTRVVFRGGAAIDVRVKMTKAARSAAEVPAPAVTVVVTPTPTPSPTPEPTAPPVTVRIAEPAPQEEPTEPDAEPDDPTTRAVWEGVMVVGLLIYGYFKRKVVRAAWAESMTWGVSVMLVPGAQLIYVSRHWEDVKPWVLWMYLAGLPLACVGAFFSR